jgi:cysteine desulfurase / selenocysteine lyase
MDHAATSHPKPEAVYEQADAALRAGGNPGRGGHRLALAAGRRIMTAREAIAGLFGLSDAGRVLFTGSATDSLNLALKGLLQPGDHVVTSSAEHNALRRPLAALTKQGVLVTRVPVRSDGSIDPAAVQAAVTPRTRLIAMAHGCNVTGALRPVADLGELARRAGALLLVDAAQTAGTHDLNMERLGIHLLAAPGHKGLLGPQGTGILCVAPVVDLRPVREGGTGSRSSQEEQPALFPEGFESGTLNTPGICGLHAGVNYLLEQGIDRIRRHEEQLTAHLLKGLRQIPGVSVYGPDSAADRSTPVAFTVAGLDPADVEEALDEEYGVAGRAGLHCNPGAHAAMGTLSVGGAMRLSPGYCTTAEEIEAVIAAVEKVASRRDG